MQFYVFNVLGNKGYDWMPNTMACYDLAFMNFMATAMGGVVV